MKVGNKLLNRIVAVGMLAVVLFVQIPFSYASVDSETFSNWFSSGRYHDRGKLGADWHGYDVEFTCEGSDPIYLTEYKDGNNVSTTCEFYSKSNFSVTYTFYDGDKTVNTLTKNVYSNTCSMFGVVYSCSFPVSYIPTSFHRTVVNIAQYEKWRDSGAVEYCHNENSMLHLEAIIVYGGLSKVGEDSDWISLDGDGLSGSRENPIEDSNIGTLLLDRSKCYWTEGGEQPTVQRISWKNKTDSGFSLNNNKYALTRIEVKIGNRVTYFGDVEHHGNGKEVDNFGKVYPFKYVNPKDNPYDFSFTEMLTASQTDLKKYNPAMLEHEYDLYFRVICSDAIGTSAKYYVGKWTRYRCTDDPKQKGDNESDDGHFDENGEWKKDKDTDVDSGGIGNVKDEDEKKDDFNNFTDSENWKDWLNEGGLDLDSAKAFISQIAEVPKMIGDIFSFLPKWVLYSFALGFGLIPVVIVIKFLRG